MKNIWLLATLLIAMNPIYAKENQSSGWQFYPSAGFGWHQLEFDRPDGTLSASYQTLNFGLTATLNDFFVSFNGEWLGKSNFQNEDEFTSVEREDNTLTVGKVFDRISVFGGYTKAETKDDFLGEFHFDEGFFIGAGYNFPMGKSNLGVSLGYANLDGEIFEDEVGVIESGKTKGLSYRINYSGPFRKDMGYKIFARFRSYEFTSDGVTTDKDILSVGASISF